MAFVGIEKTGDWALDGAALQPLFKNLFFSISNWCTKCIAGPSSKAGQKLQDILDTLGGSETQPGGSPSRFG